MKPSGLARGHGGGSRRAWSALLLGLFALALTVPGVAAADPSGGNGAGPGQQAEPPGEAAGAGGGNHPAETPTEAAAEDSSGKATTGEGNGNGNAGGNGNGQQANETGTAVGAPASTGDAGSAATDASGAAPTPTTTTEQTAAIDQGVSATAVAEQQGGNGNGNANGHDNHDGNGNGNANGNGNGNGNGNAYGHGNGNGNASSVVRVDDPGAQGGVSQTNQANAAADATATATVDTAGTATIAQAADASATATQVEVGNVHVSVRVESPGDDGAVTQVNHAAAASSASVAAETDGGGSVSQAGSAEADATAVQEQVTNTVITVRVLSPGTDGAVSQVNEAAAAATADVASATAVQDDVRNTYVGIRVESPGERGPIGQSSDAAAHTTAGGAVTVVTDGLDTVVIADIVAPNLTLPGRTTVWEWIWIWNADEATLDDAGARVVAGDTWSWAWDDLPGGTIAERQASEGERAGTWVWDWTWSREVDGWAWGWAQRAALACGTCAWVWNWDWSWTGRPDGRDGEASVQAGTGVSNQTTTVSASATAHADATLAQRVAQDDGAVERFAGQIAATAQLVEASAVASQQLEDAALTVAPAPGGVRRSIVVADATAIVSVDQAIAQLGDVVGAGVLEQWAGQQTAVAQHAEADAVGGQVLDGAAATEGAALASAVVASDNEQSVFQHGRLGDGLLVQWSGQLTDVVQVAGSNARVTQVARERDSGEVASAKANSANLAVAAQSSVQDGARSAGIGSQTVAQLVQVAQDAGSIATTAQSGESDAGLATSNATAVNRSISLQAGTQAMNGASAIDVQDLLQEALVTQTAFASSSSAGGIGGPARTVNCSTTDQGASQGIGGLIPVGAVDLTSFCTPPVPAPLGGDAGAHDAAIADTAGSSSIEQPASVVTVATLAAVDEDVAAGHGTRNGPVRTRNGPVRRAALRPSPVTQASTELAPAAALPARAEPRSQVSFPTPPQARFDSRPEGSSGREAVERESPLPPTEGPPPWASALAEGLAAFGGSGIAAILLALVLTPPALRRVRDGAVVRRPTSVLAPIDVPI